MTSRERVRLILNHQEADRPAIDMGGTSVTGTSAWTYRALKKYLGIHNDSVRVFDLFQMLAEPEPELMDRLGCDVVLLPKEKLIMGLTYGKWKPWTFWDGQTFEVPADFNPVVKEDGTMEIPFTPGGSNMMRMPAGGRFFDSVPIGNSASIDVPHWDEKDWTYPGPMDEAFLQREAEKARHLFETSERAIFAEPPLSAPVGYGGLYGFALKMMTEPDHCRTFMMKQAEAAAQCYEQYLDAVGAYIDVIAICLADFGVQDREIFAPELFAEFYVPAWRLISDVIHAKSKAKVWIHSCGSVPHLMQCFIDAGVDCVNPVQWTAAGMDLRSLKAQYGDKLVFWGGAISTQKTFPFGSTEDVIKEATEVLDIMSLGGGYVCNQIHNILAEVPVENIVALYETAKNYRYGS